MAVPIDYCSQCRTSCCDPVEGLKVTRAEYDGLFRSVAGNLSVNDCGPFLEVTSLHGSSCPHFKDRKCSVYDRRPVECRLYPYSIETITEHAGEVRAYVHAATPACPFKAELLPEESEVRGLVTRFLEDAYPSVPRRIEVRRNPNYHLLRLRRLRKKVGRKAAEALGRVWPSREAS